jgi:DNA-binding FrmR family transcriptional regulator
MTQASKTSVLKRLSRIEGQVRGLTRMVEEDRYCIDIVTQISAVRAALRKAEGKFCAITSRIASSMPSFPAMRTSKGARSRS